MTVESRKFALGSFSRQGGVPFLGLLIDDAVVPVAEVTRGKISASATMLDLLRDWTGSLATLKAALAAHHAPAATPVSDLTAHAPIPTPPQLFCTGANYGRHVIGMVMSTGGGPGTENMNQDELRAFAEGAVKKQKAESNPFVFMKPVTSVIGPCDPLVLPDFSEKADWEIEIGVVMGVETYRVSRDKALDCVAGYMVVNDLTARDKVKRTDIGAIGPDWIASKGAPGFLPTGPYLVPAEFVPDPQSLDMRLSVNGLVMQDDNSSDMTFDIARQIEFISSYARLLPGDIICSGTPGGNGITRGIFLKEGDVMEAEIEGLGKQITHCVAV